MNIPPLRLACFFLLLFSACQKSGGPASAETSAQASAGGSRAPEPRIDSRAEKEILHNARQLAAAVDIYCEENKATSVELSQLIGPTLYIKSLKTWANETYPSKYYKGQTITVTGIAGSRTMTYAP